MRSIASFHALSDRELIELARDHTSSLLGSDMHGLALVLARRLESTLSDRQSERSRELDLERAAANFSHPVDMEVP